MRFQIICMLILGLLVAATAQARVKLVALPERETIKIRLDNPAATLVQEERLLTLQKGSNQIDFSWKGVNIDPESIRLRPLDHPQKVRLIAVNYPPNEDALVWQVYSEQAIQEKVRITYLLSGIDRLVTYKAISDQDENYINLKSYLVLRNFSGENFQAANCMLGNDQSFETDIKDRATKRMLFLQEHKLPFVKELTWDAQKMPHEPEKEKNAVGLPVQYVLENTKQRGLGEKALLPGKARIFQEDGQGSTIFLGEDRAGFTPVGGKMKLYIGDSRDVAVTQRRMQTQNTDIRRDDDGNIQVYDQICRDRIKIENFKDEKLVLTIIEHIQGQWEPLDFSHDFERKDHSTLHFKVEVPAQGKEIINMRYKLRNIFARQYRVYNKVVQR